MKFESAFWFLTTALIFASAFQAKAQGETPDRLYRIQAENKFGFIDKSGKVIVPPVLDEAGEFSERLAYAKKGDRVGFIDATGGFVIKPKFYQATSFADGLAAVWVPGTDAPLYNGEWVFIDKSGKTVLGSKFAFNGAQFAEGMAAFFDGEKYGFIDKTGKIVIEPQFPRPFTVDILGRPRPTDSGTPFREGLAVVKLNGKQAFLDKTGKIVQLPEKYRVYSEFSEGLVRVSINYNEGFLDAGGNIVIKPVWRTVGDFS